MRRRPSCRPSRGARTGVRSTPTSTRCSASTKPVERTARFDSGIENAVRFILTSPKFLFRDEPDPASVAAGAVYPVSDLELASRLSFFLWSSVPDDQLLTAASQGKLRDPAVLERQVRRMLADPRSKALVDNFAAQWLFVRNLQSFLPDTATFPNFDDNLRQAIPQGDRALLREHDARGPERPRPPDRRLHVRQRAPRAPLRHLRTSTAASSAA